MCSMFPKIFEKYPTADGFVVMREAVVFNYWNLASANKTNLWNFHQVCCIFVWSISVEVVSDQNVVSVGEECTPEF